MAYPHDKVETGLTATTLIDFKSRNGKLQEATNEQQENVEQFPAIQP